MASPADASAPFLGDKDRPLFKDSVEVDYFSKGGKTDGLTEYTGDVDEEDNADSVESQAISISMADTKRAMIMLSITIFLQSCGFSIVLPTLYSFLHSEGASVFFLGVIMSLYSFAQFLASPALGFWSNHRSTQEALVVSLVISAAGNFLYGFAVVLPGPIWFILIARIIVGIGAGNVSVCRAYVSHMTTMENRTAYMALMSAAQGLGFAFGPGMGFCLSYLDFKIVGIPVNEFTAVGYVSALLLLIDMFIMLIVGTPEPKHAHADSTADDFKFSKLELVPVIVTIANFFIITGIFAVFETMLTVVTSKDFDWGSKINGLLFVAAALISLVTFVLISTFLSKKFSDGLLLIVSWCILIVALGMMANVEPLEPDLPVWQFLVGAFLLSIGYPMCSSVIFSLYSKVLHPRAQGTKMGWLTAAGSLSRMLMPLWGSQSWKLGKGELLFLSTAGTAVVGLVLTLGFYRFLKPHPEHQAIRELTPEEESEERKALLSDGEDLL